MISASAWRLEGIPSYGAGVPVEDLATLGLSYACS